jgi:hypothetical protein
LTPEFFTRPDKIELYCEKSDPVKSREPETGFGVWIENGRKYYGDRSDPVEIPVDSPRRPDRNHFYNPGKKAWEI